MNKVICDMCGTTYSETASHCPICGYARQEDAKVIFDPDAVEETKRSHVRGGRFSASNVRKISSAEGKPMPDDDYDSDEPEKSRSGLNLALGITAIILFIMLVAVLISFGMKIAQNAGKYDQLVPTAPAGQNKSVSCESISVDSAMIDLTAAGNKHIVQYSLVPADTTDSVKFSSNAPDIASVDDKGTVTALATGEAIITISCGGVTQTITVVCSFDAEAQDKWDLIGDEVIFENKGDSQDIYSVNSTLARENVSWTSDNQSVATVKGGIVTAVGSGSTYVHAEYNGVKISCRIECTFKEESQTGASNVDIDSLKMSNKKGDVTLVANGASYEKSFELYLVDKNGTRVDVTWTASKDGIVQIEGSKITGIKAGSYTVVKATYEGKTFECTVRVRNN